jgi:hypothetical protein
VVVLALLDGLVRALLDPQVLLDLQDQPEVAVVAVVDIIT